MPTTREALLRILALIEKGWTRGHNHKRRGDRVYYCLNGAIRESRGDYYALHSALEAGISGFPEHYLAFIRVVDWNDDPKRTKRQVIALLKRVIARA